MKITLAALSALCVSMPMVASASPADYAAAYNHVISEIEAEPDANEEIEATFDQSGLDITRNAEGEVTEMVMFSDVAFEFGSAELSSDAIAILEAVAAKLKSVPGLEIEGHTDSIGGEDDNLALGLARAETVGGWLIERGYFDSDALTLISAGEASPLVPNLRPDGGDDAVARAQNRRVAFHVVEPEFELEKVEGTASVATPAELNAYKTAKSGPR